MQPYSVLQCTICYEDFDLAERVPRMLQCGHTVCNGCLNRLLISADPKCPLDMKKFSSRKSMGGKNALEEFPVNFVLRDQLEEKAKGRECPVHLRKLELYCMTDKVGLCFECALFDGHKDHVLKPLRDTRDEATQKLEKLEKEMEDLEKLAQKAGDELENKRMNLFKQIDDHFNNLINLIKTKKQQAVTLIDVLFLQEKIRAESEAGLSSAVKNMYEEKILKYKEQILNQDFSPILEDDISHLKGVSSQQDIASKGVEEFNEKVNKISLELITSLDSVQSNLVKLFEENIIEEVDRMTNLTFRPHKDHLEIISSHTETKGLQRSYKEWEAINGVKFILNNCRLKEEDMTLIKIICKQFKRLGWIGISCENQTSIPEVNFAGVCNNIFCKPEVVQAVDLSFWNSQVTEQSMILLMEKILSKAVNLTSLSLNLESTNITDQAIISLGKSVIPNLRKLESLTICLGDTGVRAQAVTQMFTAMPDMKYFDLNVKGISFSDLNLELLLANALASMNRLESLSLCLSETKVGDEGMVNLLSSQNMKGLKELILNLSNTLITNKTAKLLVTRLKEMKQLKTFSFNFNSTKVTEKNKSLVLQAWEGQNQYIMGTQKELFPSQHIG